MSFTGYIFWYFFVILFFLYWFIRHHRLQNALLILGGYIFIGWINIWYTILIGFITISTYLSSYALSRWLRFRKVFFIFGLTTNLGLLIFFKYTNFLGNNLEGLLKAFGFHLNPFIVNIILPLGISVYIFQATGYLIDVYRGGIKTLPEFFDFSLFICFFPLLASGPIERARNLIPQITTRRIWNWKNLYTALPLIVMGLMKKMVIGDNISIYVDKVYMLKQPTFFVLFAATVAFTLQVYTDFSAYTDIARGCAKLLGFDIMVNFNSPYLSLSPIEFWRRWHISLSTWFRDYVFFPLERTRKGKNSFLQYGNTILVFLLTGLWHGAEWNFILWGLYYGIFISIYNYLGFGGNWKPKNLPNRLIAWIISTLLTIFGWMIFRAPSLSWLSRTLVNFHPGLSGSSLIVGIVILSFTLLYSIPLLVKYGVDNLSTKWSLITPVYYAVIIILILILKSPGTQDFIYFKF